jgi:capsular polysaccharide biosynthesis protein
VLQRIRTSIGTVTATDGDVSDTVTFTVSGSELSITSAGVLTFAVAPDYETKTSYTATVTASDGTNTTNQNITVNVTNLNDNSPVFTSGATFSADENQASIGTVTATDGDVSDTVTFTVSGSELSITSAGVLTFVVAPDYEAKTSYTATVTASDGTNTTTQNITVNVTNLNDNSPVFTSDTTFSADENQASIGTVTATDGDVSDTVTFTVSGSELSITSAGVLTFVVAPDYEAKTSYTATVTASDGTNTTTQNITVNVTNLNDNSPVFTSDTTFSADENQASIGTVTATDGDVSDTVTFTVSGSELSITSAGVLTFVVAPDYETKTSYTATVTASDGTNSTNQNITILVTDINDNSPVFTSGATFSAAENQTSIGTVTATDGDVGDTINYSINNAVEQRIEVSIAANESGSGNVYVIGGVKKRSLTFEVGQTYKFEHPGAHPLKFSVTSDGIHGGGIEYTDGTDTSQAGVTLITISEQTPATLYYYCSVHTGMGSDVNSTVNEAPKITISSSGDLAFNKAPDYESIASFSGIVTASDGLNSTLQSIQVNIVDANDSAPVITSNPIFNVQENQTSIGTVTATDPEDDAVTFTISGSELLISSAGVLTFTSAPDYETKSSYTATVTASDGTNTTEQGITVNVTNLNDNAPVFTSGATLVQQRIKLPIGTVTATDGDGDSVTFTVSGF